VAAAKRSAKRSQDGPSYLPTCRNGRTGADLSVLRARPAPIAAAALDRRHECALRDGLARPSLQRTADERARRRSVVIHAQPSVGVLMVVLYILATGTVGTHTCSMRRCARVIHRLDRRRRLRRCRRTCSGVFLSTHSGTLRTGRDSPGYCEYSHLQCTAVCSWHSPPRPSAAVVPAHLQFASGRPRRGDVRTARRACAPSVLSSVAGPAARSGVAPVVDNTLQ
jgi:hypothetical protein